MIRSEPRAGTSEQRGTALIWALLFVVVTSGMVISHAVFLASSRREHDVRYSQEAMASTFARSGLVDSLGWFRAQEAQPVTSFDPLLDPAGDPPRFDTIDPTLGLVREFEIRGNLWGRYEVRREDVADVSAQRGQTQTGTVWEVSARSYVYRVYDSQVPFDQAPNRLVASTRMTSELRGIPLVLPAAAAINVDDPSKVSVRRNAVVKGMSRIGIAYRNTTADELLPVAPLNLVDLAATLTGTPDRVALPTLNSDPDDVFSMQLTELLQYSDVVFQRDSYDAEHVEREFDRKVVFINGNLDLDRGLNMRRALLVIDGNLDLREGSTSSVDGVVYVAGNAKFEGDLSMRGSLVVRGNLDIGGGTGTVEIVYDPTVINELRGQIGKYRMRRTVLPGQ